MTFDQFITVSNIIDNLVDTDRKSSELLAEAFGYQRNANALLKVDYEDAKHVNGYYRDTMDRLANRLVALTGFEKATVKRALVTIANDRF